MNFFLISALFFSTTLSSLATSFNDEKIKLMKTFNDLKIYKRLHNYYVMKHSKAYFKTFLDLDSVIFFNGMREEKDKIFLLTFWINFESTKYLFFCSEYYKECQKDFNTFIDQISSQSCYRASANIMLYNFKIYLMQALSNYQGNKAKMLFEAEQFYKLRLKGLILEVLNGRINETHYEKLNQMDQNFRFYYHCIEKDNFMYLLTKEFHAFKLAKGSIIKEPIVFHAVKMAFLAGILKEDRSSILGLRLISDQSPEFIGYFIYMQCNQREYLDLDRQLPIKLSALKHNRNDLLRYLFEKISIFNYSNGKFELLKGFKNEYADILNNDELIYLAKTLYRKILLS
jgi:hypothetical protein